MVQNKPQLNSQLLRKIASSLGWLVGNKYTCLQISFFKKAEPQYPSACSDSGLADQFNAFFNSKIRLIREGLLRLTADAAYSAIPSTSCQCELRSFERVSPAHFANVFKSCKVKICGALDPLLASVLTGCLLVLLAVITDLVNCSLDTAFMPVVLKTAMITPLLKKSNLSTDDFSQRVAQLLSFSSRTAIEEA